MIYIYDDGVFNNSFVHMALHMVGYRDVQFCSATMILQGCLNKANLLIMPGGADLYFCDKLNGQSNSLIKDFVSNGGSYLGICAGAYYGCANIDWGCGEIAGARELDFYPGKAEGPVYEWIENKEKIYDGSWLKAVEIETESGEKFLMQYNGGAIFETPQERDFKVLAHYTELPDKPAAIVSGTYGAGKYILSSPHIENIGHLLFDRLYEHLNQSFEREKTETEKLIAHSDKQKEFFRSIIQRLL